MNLRDKYIFILGTAKFDGPYESTSFTIAKELARENKVFYIDYPFTLKDCIRFRSKKEFQRRKPYLSPFSDGILSTETPNLKIIITPPLFSINFLPEGKLYRLFLRLNEQIISRRIKKVIKKSKISGFIYINSFNFHYPDIAGSIHPQLTVYYCVDPMIIPYDMRHGIVSEKILVEKSDVVICTSKELYSEKKELNKNTFFIPNAADIEHSIKALNEDLPVHPSIAVLKKPVAGYFGHIERRMDFDLLQEVIKMNPDKSFAFVGPVSPEFVPGWFYTFPNVHLVDRQPYQQMPNIIKGFDVALIPFRKDNVSKTIFPLKLFEYLGAGKPVVATDFNPDLREFTYGTVDYCENAIEFSKAINNAIQDHTASKIQERVAIAKENTWAKRVQEISTLLAARLPG